MRFLRWIFVICVACLNANFVMAGSCKNMSRTGTGIELAAPNDGGGYFICKEGGKGTYCDLNDIVLVDGKLKQCAKVKETIGKKNVQYIKWQDYSMPGACTASSPEDFMQQYANFKTKYVGNDLLVFKYVANKEKAILPTCLYSSDQFNALLSRADTIKKECEASGGTPKKAQGFDGRLVYGCEQAATASTTGAVAQQQASGSSGGSADEFCGVKCDIKMDGKYLVCDKNFWPRYCSDGTWEPVGIDNCPKNGQAPGSGFINNSKQENLSTKRGTLTRVSWVKSTKKQGSYVFDNINGTNYCIGCRQGYQFNEDSTTCVPIPNNSATLSSPCAYDDKDYDWCQPDAAGATDGRCRTLKSSDVTQMTCATINCKDGYYLWLNDKGDSQGVCHSEKVANDRCTGKCKDCNGKCVPNIVDTPKLKVNGKTVTPRSQGAYQGCKCEAASVAEEEYSVDDTPAEEKQEVETPVAGEKIQINGVVKAKDGETLPGATIKVSDTQGTITDTDGNFKLSDVDTTATVNISFTGCQPVDKGAKELQNATIELECTNNTLNEVSVVPDEITLDDPCVKSGGEPKEDGSCDCGDDGKLKPSDDGQTCVPVVSDETGDDINEFVGGGETETTTPPDENKLEDAIENYQKAKENEQSLANRTLTAATTAATGLGMMTAASAMAEQNADADAEEDMRAYLATFSCSYGKGQSVKTGNEEITLPGGNDLMSYYSEYKSLADNLKTTKAALGLRSGIESEVMYDKAESGLYKYASVGKTDGAYTSLARALTDETGEDAAEWNAQKDKSAKKLKTGGIAAGVGAVGGIAGNVAINTDLIKNIKEKFGE